MPKDDCGFMRRFDTIARLYKAAIEKRDIAAALMLRIRMEQMASQWAHLAYHAQYN